MKAALYARFSTTRQKSDSIEDQFRVCERVAADNGLAVALRFEDRGISGGTHRRPGYQALLVAARNGQFTTLIAEDLKRLWREQAEQWRCIKELIDLGIVLITASGIDSRQPNFELLAAVIGATAELDRVEGGYRVRRGTAGHARRGGAISRCYGYLSKKHTRTGQVEINPAEAEIVRWVFDRYLSGWSPCRISRELLRAQIPPPTGRFGTRRTCRGWAHSTIQGASEPREGLLHHELYVGVNVWGRGSKQASAADSTQTRRIEHPQSEWIRCKIERLRIIPEDVWHRAQLRSAEQTMTVCRPPRSASISRRAALVRGGFPHTFFSLLRCDACGSMLIRANSHEYICGAHTDGACSNGILLSQKTTHRQLLAAADAEILPDRSREVLLWERERQSARRPRHKPPERHERRVAQVEVDLDNFRAMTKHPRFATSPDLLRRLKEAEDSLAKLIATRPAMRKNPLQRQGEPHTH